MLASCTPTNGNSSSSVTPSEEPTTSQAPSSSVGDSSAASTTSSSSNVPSSEGTSEDSSSTGSSESDSQGTESSESQTSSSEGESSEPEESSSEGGTSESQGSSSEGGSTSESGTSSEQPTEPEIKELTVVEAAAYEEDDVSQIVSITGVAEDYYKNTKGTSWSFYLADSETGKAINIFKPTSDATFEYNSDEQSYSIVTGSTAIDSSVNGKLVKVEGLITIYNDKAQLSNAKVTILEDQTAAKPASLIAGNYTGGTVEFKDSNGIAVEAGTIDFGKVITIVPAPATGYMLGGVKVDHGYYTETITAATDGTYSFDAWTYNKVLVDFIDMSSLEKLSVSQALTKTKKLASGKESDDYYAVSAQVNGDYNTSNKWYEFADLNDETQKIYFYDPKQKTNFSDGDVVTVVAKLKNYKNTYELDYYAATLDNSVCSVTADSSIDSAKGTIEFANITKTEAGSEPAFASAVSGSIGDVIKVKVNIVNSDYEIDTIKQNGLVVSKNDDGDYTFRLDSNVVVTATFKETGSAPAEKAKQYSYIFKDGDTTEAGNTGIDGKWAASSATYVGFESSNSMRGLQIGSNNNPQKSDWTLTAPVSDFGSKVVGIAIESSVNSSGKSTISIKAGDHEFYQNSSFTSITSVALGSTSNTLLSLEEAVTSGDIVITLKSLVKKGMYIKSVTVWYYWSVALNVPTSELLSRLAFPFY